MKKNIERTSIRLRLGKQKNDKNKRGSSQSILHLPSKSSQNLRFFKLQTVKRERLSLVFRGRKLAKAFPSFCTSSSASNIGRYESLPLSSLSYV